MDFVNNRKPYVAIIGDIKSSKNLTDRNEIQKKLKFLLNNINEKFKDNILSKFTITLGDEFQGLLFNCSDVMKIISEIERGIYPVKVRFGIGIGIITTEINRDMAIGADGPGYYNARSAINYLKENEKKKQSVESDIRLETDGNNREIVILINTILSLMYGIKDHWSDRQREIIWNMIKYNDSQTDLAERLNIKQSSVQKSLVKGNFYTYKESVETIERILTMIWG